MYTQYKRLTDIPAHSRRDSQVLMYTAEDTHRQGCGAGAWTGTGTGTGRNRIHLRTSAPEPEPYSEYGSGSGYKEMSKQLKKFY